MAQTSNGTDVLIESPNLSFPMFPSILGSQGFIFPLIQKRDTSLLLLA